MNEQTISITRWNFAEKSLFRFFFIYFLLFFSPIGWLGVIPGINYLVGYYYQANDWLIRLANAHLFHIKDQLVPFNGSGDTSFGWAQVSTFLLLSFVGAGIWSILDRKRINYIRLRYWLCLIVRYQLIITCCSYGFIKLFNLQMPFPAYSQLATPLGDLLPMRLSWMFLGYSHLYQGFSGALEVLAAIFLLFRRTSTLGSLMAAGVFLNVAMLNLSYDIPVKIYSIHSFLLCMFLLIIDRKRLMAFFVLNRTAEPSLLYEYSPSKKWMRYSKTGLKLLMIYLSFGYNIYGSVEWYQAEASKRPLPPLQAGLYDVATYVLNKDTLPPLLTDSTRWLNVAIENDGGGSINTIDTAFRVRYNRSYFAYEPDTSQQLIRFKRNMYAEPLFSLQYQVIDSNTISLKGLRNKDSLFIVLKKSKRHFQLGEKQFHWLSEANR